MFLLGPAITEARGIGTAIVYVGSVLVVLWLVTCAEVIIGRRALKTGGPKLAWFLIEGAICPGLMANVWRRLLLMRCHRMDAVEFFAPTLSAVESGDVLLRLEAYLADLEEREAISTTDARVFATYRVMLGRSEADPTHND
ncbi:hypothetical protein [Reyranella sp.]|uniref:hypothetical protein n=1 Tax=Reyranella sp. TaxID=1929291 RepID=UPI003784C2D2